MNYSFKSVENNTGLMAEGEYEVYVKQCEVTHTKSGTECISFDFVVRPDIDQPYQNKHIFKKFYRDDETGEYPAQKIGKYANALGIEKGKEFELDELIGRSCICRISHFTGSDGVVREVIFYLAHSKAEPFIAVIPEAPLEEITEDDAMLPF